MSAVVVGLSHKSAPVEVRERAAFQVGEAAERLSAAGLAEGLVLSTCNRTEIYTVGGPAEMAAAEEILAEKSGMSLAELEPYLYRREGAEAVRHLFRVASGLEAMVVGETQILAQVKEAYLDARERGYVGPRLGMLFEACLAAAKRVHTETGINQNAVSVSYAAVELLKKVFDTLQGKKALLIGAGRTSELTLEHLREAGVAEIFVANRTLAHAEELANRFDAVAVDFVAIDRTLREVDVVLTSTGAPHLILDREALAVASQHRHQRPLFLFDLAVPRDIDPEASGLPGIYLYDIDDLEAVVDQNIQERRRQAVTAEEIISEEVAKFITKERSREAIPLIRSLRGKVEEIRRRELARAFQKLPDLTDRQRQVIEAMTVMMMNKILNDPTLVIKEYANQEDAALYLEAASRLFRLDGDASPGWA